MDASQWIDTISDNTLRWIQVLRNRPGTIQAGGVTVSATPSSAIMLLVVGAAVLLLLSRGSK